MTSDLAHGRGMVFLHHADPRFRRGLAQHGLDSGQGTRILHSGFHTTPFRARRDEAEQLAAAQASGRPFHLDRLTGGMPFQPLDGIRELAQSLRESPAFLGFQVHEWDNSPLYDYRRIITLLLDKGVPFDRAHFAEYAGRTSFPYFSGGDYAMYRDLFRPLDSLDAIQAYLEAYFGRLIALTEGQVLAVNGYRQLYHAALRLGAKHVMAEIGNQVALTAWQIACVRGAAVEYGKPFGVYYETWGGSPFGCTCATDFSPWFATREQFQAFHDMGSVGPAFGSSRALQRRLLYYSWLSGAAWWSEEWGAENYFADWDAYPLTDYGRIVRDFFAATAGWGPVTPIVPAAIVLPAGTFGLDNGYLAGKTDSLFGMAAPDACHEALRAFVREVFAVCPAREGGEAHNLTPSPWCHCFDVLSADAPPARLSRYPVVIYLDETQARRADLDGAAVQCYTGESGEIARCLAAIGHALPFRVEGEVGCAQADAGDYRLVGLFNNLGITKTADGEVPDPAAARVATIAGHCADPVCLTGADYLRAHSDTRVTLELPPGAAAVLAFPRQ